MIGKASLAIAAAMALSATPITDLNTRPGPSDGWDSRSRLRFGNKKTVSKAHKKARAKIATQSKRRNRK